MSFTNDLNVIPRSSEESFSFENEKWNTELRREDTELRREMKRNLLIFIHGVEFALMSSPLELERFLVEDSSE